MGKGTLKKFVVDHTGITLAEAGIIVDVVIKGLIQDIIEYKWATLPNFGRFEIRETRPHKGRNPRTGEGVLVPAKRTVRFKAARELKNLVQT